MTGSGSGWGPPQGPPQGGVPYDSAASGPPTAAAWYPQGTAPPAPTGVGYGNAQPDIGGPPPALPPPLPPAPPPRNGFGGGRLAAVVVLAVAVVVVAVVAIVLATTGGDPSTSPTQVAATGPSTADFPTDTTPTDVSTPTEPPTTEVPSTPATTAAPTVSASGIDIAAIGGNPHAIPVTTMFDTYFGGINAHDAATATSVFAPGNSFDPSDPNQVANFNDDISTTSDSAIVIRSITSTAAGLDVLVTFTSNQAPSLGPDGQACTNWRIVYHLVAVGNGVGIVKASADYVAC